MRFNMDKKDNYKELKVNEVVDLLDISKSTVYRRLKKGEIDGYKDKGKYGFQWFIPISESKNEELYQKFKEKKKNSLTIGDLAEKARKNINRKFIQNLRTIQESFSFKTAAEQFLQEVASKSFLQTAASQYNRQFQKLIPALETINFAPTLSEVPQIYNISMSKLVEELNIYATEQLRQFNAKINSNLTSEISSLFHQSLQNLSKNLVTASTYNIIISEDIRRANQLLNKLAQDIINDLAVTSINQPETTQVYSQSYLHELEYLLNNIETQLQNLDILDYSEDDFSKEDKVTRKVYRKLKWLKDLIERIQFIYTEIYRGIAENLGVNYILLFQFINLYILLLLFISQNPHIIGIYFEELQNIFPKILKTINQHIDWNTIISKAKNFISLKFNVPSYLLGKKNSNNNHLNLNTNLKFNKEKGIYLDNKENPYCTRCIDIDKQSVHLKNAPPISQYDYICPECGEKY